MGSDDRYLKVVQSLPISEPDSSVPSPAVATAETINPASACAELLEVSVPDSGSLPANVPRWIDDWTTERESLPGALSAMHQQQLTEAESKLAVASLLRVAAQRVEEECAVAAIV